MKNIAVYGAGGQGREVKMLIEQINSTNTQFNFVGFYDDGMEAGRIVNGYPVMGGLDSLNKVKEPLGIIVAIGNPKVKKKIVERIQNPLIHYPTLIHPNVYVGNDDVSIGEGCIITANCVITVNIRIGKHVLLNWGCTIGHDTIVGDYCSFMPSVNVSGEVVIKETVYAGTGAKIINQCEIGEETTIGMGAIVTKSLPPKCTAVGMPAKPIKFHE